VIATGAWLAQIGNWLSLRIPMLEHAALVQLWAGLRPLSPDAYPLLGRASGWENVILATGHGSAGFELSAITGQVQGELSHGMMKEADKKTESPMREKCGRILTAFSGILRMYERMFEGRKGE
jgi:glycine/D-amino acid oxidase-like deaminating enzyme